MLNLVTKEEENKYCTNNQPIEIINIFKFMYLLFNKSYEGLEEKQIISKFIKEIMVNELNKKSLSKN